MNMIARRSNFQAELRSLWAATSYRFRLSLHEGHELTLIPPLKVSFRTGNLDSARAH